MKIRVADYIIDKLYAAGGEHIFLITGGMIMHLTDALLKAGKQKFICCHHEQAVVMAAEAYGRFTNRLGVALVTAGPGALNTVNAVVGAYVDSSPCIIVAGQSKVSQAKVTGPRQFALQGFNNLPIFKNITKYAVMLDEVSKVKYEVEKCIYLAKAARVGPVYLECPIDIQGAIFDPAEFEGFNPPLEDKTRDDLKLTDEKIKLVKDSLLKSRRPCLIAGAGIRLADSIDQLYQFITSANIPVLTSRLGMDLIGDDHPLFVGRPGLYGDRPANFTIQNSDLILSIGCRLGIGIVGHDFEKFSPRAKKIIVDIDEKELAKPSLKPDIAICADAKIFLEQLIGANEGYHFNNTAWLKQIRAWRQGYPVDLPEYKNERDGINSYHFIRVFSEMLGKDGVLVLDTGSCFHVYAQAFKVKFGQRHIITGGLSTMGYMPAVIGVAAANKGREVYCVTGDGSLQMNLQELQTIVHNRLKVKIIVFNNKGYLLIRHTQDNFMEGRRIGESCQTGVSFPDLKKIAKAYGIDFMRIENNRHLNSKLKAMIEHPRAIICEVMTPPQQLLIPRVAAKKLDNGQMVSMPYDDMYPFLPREEYLANCVADKII